MTARSPRLTISRILEWADEHCERTGRWPTSRSGAVRGARGERWHLIDEALQKGRRGLRGGTTLARLLAARRNKSMNTNRPPLTEREILRHVDAHRRRTGRWPTARSGRVTGGRGWTWQAIDRMLRRSGHDGLAHLIAAHRPKHHPGHLPRLTIKQILDWADGHHRRTGRYPVRTSGAVSGAPAETWANIDAALRIGRRGLRGDSSLARVLAGNRRVPLRIERRPPLSVNQILLWADRHYRRTGSWPDKHSGPIPRSGGETWIAVEEALHRGKRGMPGGITLIRFLARHRGRPYRRKGPDLSIRDILDWAAAHYRRTGSWPTQSSGPVTGAPGERWGNIQSALYKGSRGLRGGSSLPKLIEEHFGR